MPIARPPVPTPARPRESTLTTLTAFAALPMSVTDEEGNFSPPGIGEFFPIPFTVGGEPVFDRIMLVRLIAMAAVVLVMVLYVQRARLVPSRYSSTVEFGLDLVRTQVAEQILGQKDGRRFLPLLATFFFLIFALNITGIVPLLNIGGTSVIGVPLLLAAISYLTFIVVGIRAQGVGGYFQSNLFPPGVPKPLYLLVTPIEFASTFLIRPFSLTIRLLANLIAGHLLLVLCFKSTQYFLEELLSGNALGAMFVLTLVGGFAFTLFEILVAVLQAYIFTLLTAVYISGALHPEH
ncbi:F0F1 ATP synthase subunit A [Aquipuribacter nitratireducens]|uniref:ATP synthase subunit a n=1 Tax=Aquipuribacter nitratireducens TaxID=650104 RepID=A0ABW0GKY1_9MICO